MNSIFVKVFKTAIPQFSVIYFNKIFYYHVKLNFTLYTLNFPEPFKRNLFNRYNIF